MSNLQKSDLKRTLIKTYPRDFIDMLAWDEKYAWIEDAFMQEEAPATSILRGGERMQNA